MNPIMLGIFYALITVLAWGTSLTLSQNINFKNQQIKTFNVAVANLGLAFVVTLVFQQGQLKISDFWGPFNGGLVFSVSGLCAITATDKIGMARAFGVWAPINIIVSIFWGAVLFNEFPITTPLSLPVLLGTLAIIIAGMVMIILAKGGGEKIQNAHTTVIGFLAAFGAGILWGSYYSPLKMSGIAMWVAAFPLAIGIFTGSSILVIMTRQPIRLKTTTIFTNWRNRLVMGNRQLRHASSGKPARCGERVYYFLVIRGGQCLDRNLLAKRPAPWNQTCNFNPRRLCFINCRRDFSWKVEITNPTIR
jgi:glucose uptake protein